MARLVLVCIAISMLSACAQNSIKRVQDTLDKQVEADSAYISGDCDKAIILYLELAEAMKTDTKSVLRAGNCAARSGDLYQAEQRFQEVLLRDPKNVKGWYNLSYIRAQILADTVTKMYQNTEQTSPEAQRLRELTIKVLAPFDVELD